MFRRDNDLVVINWQINVFLTFVVVTTVTVQEVLEEGRCLEFGHGEVQRFRNDGAAATVVMICHHAMRCSWGDQKRHNVPT